MPRSLITPAGSRVRHRYVLEPFMFWSRAMRCHTRQPPLIHQMECYAPAGDPAANR